MLFYLATSLEICGLMLHLTSLLKSTKFSTKRKQEKSKIFQISSNSTDLKITLESGKFEWIQINYVTQVGVDYAYAYQISKLQGHHGEFEPGRVQYSTPNFLTSCFL